MEDRPKILIVDDDPETTEMLRRLLERDAYAVEVVNDPRLVVKKAELFRPDLFILDYDMPHLVGSDVCIQVKDLSEHRRTPIIILSGITGDDVRVITAFAGAATFLEKPVDGPKLLDTIRGLLGPDVRSPKPPPG